jgi:hypothetical protein
LLTRVAACRLLELALAAGAFGDTFFVATMSPPPWLDRSSLIAGWSVIGSGPPVGDGRHGKEGDIDHGGLCDRGHACSCDGRHKMRR